MSLQFGDLVQCGHYPGLIVRKPDQDGKVWILYEINRKDLSEIHGAYPVPEKECHLLPQEGNLFELNQKILELENNEIEFFSAEDKLLALKQWITEQVQARRKALNKIEGVKE